MFLGWAQTDHPNIIIVRPFGKNHDDQLVIDMADGNKSRFAIIKAVIETFQCRRPIKALRCPQ